MSASTEAAQPHDVDGDRPIEFARVRSRGWKGMFIAGSPLHQWFLDGGSPEDIPVPPETIVRDGSRSRCARIERLDDAHPLPERLFFKAYRRRPGVQAALKRMIGWHLPSRVWRTSWQLIRAGVPVPQPNGYLIPQLLRPGRTCYFWAEWIDGVCTAKQLACIEQTRHTVEGNPRFAEQSAELLASLHIAGFYHRDMNWGNILVQDAVSKFWLIDLDSAHRWTRHHHSAAARDVARFLMDADTYGASREWVERFFARYMERTNAAPSLRGRVQEMKAILLRRRAAKRMRFSSKI